MMVEKLKPGWKVWRFDQMATNVNVRIDNPSAWEQWQTDGRAFWQQMDVLVETLDGLAATEDSI